MTQPTPFDRMREAFTPQGTAPVTNITSNLDSPHFGSKLVLSAVNHAQKRITEIAETPDIAEPLSPLETFAIQLLMRASGQNTPAFIKD